MRARTTLLMILVSTAVLTLAPVASSAPAPKVRAAQATPAPSPHDPADFVNPVDGRVISPYGPRGGRRHDGVDIKGAPGATVFATYAGTVVQAGPGLSGYGYTVTIDHGQGVRTLYAHLASWSVKRGDVVPQGEPVGVQGQTGRVTTYHVHYEVEVNGVNRNPAPYLRY